MAKMVENENFSLRVENIYKSFFDNHVLKGVSFGIKKGEVLGLIGANGAGKSTLMKILSGVYTLDNGQIYVDGKHVSIKSARDSSRAGISMVYQEFSLIPTMTVEENLFLNRENKKMFLIDDKMDYNESKKALSDFAVSIDPKEYVENLSIGNQQQIEIVKSLMQNPSVLILDEPTASLTHKEVMTLFSFIDKLKKKGISIILITHHMQEILQICDRAIVLRNGEVALDDVKDNLSIPIIVEAMIGRKIEKDHNRIPFKRDGKDIVLSVRNASYQDKLNSISFDLYKGEILGIAGLLGSGRTELMKCIFGLEKMDSGEIFLDKKKLVSGKPWVSIENSIMLVPENRRKSGIVSIHSIKSNMLISIWKRLCGLVFINEKTSMTLVNNYKAKLDIKCVSIEQEVGRLSGGNQQKVVFGKSLLTKARVLLLDDPTVGIDIESKQAIASLIREVSSNGTSVILVSSEMEELENLCDRVIVFKKGNIACELDRNSNDSITEKTLSEAIQA